VNDWRTPHSRSGRSREASLDSSSPVSDFCFRLDWQEEARGRREDPNPWRLTELHRAEYTGWCEKVCTLAERTGANLDGRLLVGAASETTREAGS